jgi:hypothetical protein
MAGLPSPAHALAVCEPAGKIRLPQSSTRLQVPYVYVKIVEDIVPLPFGLCRFDGPIYRPGAAIAIDALPRPAVAIECAGPIGAWRRGRRRDDQYLLWTLDYEHLEWRELARAQARDASWTVAVRELAWRALHPRPELLDIMERSQDVSRELIDEIEKRLRSEMPEVQAHTLYAMYEWLAGRIAECDPKGPKKAG